MKLHISETFIVEHRPINEINRLHIDKNVIDRCTCGKAVVNWIYRVLIDENTSMVINFYESIWWIDRFKKSRILWNYGVKEIDQSDKKNSSSNNSLNNSLKASLRASARKVASEIATKTKEKNNLEDELKEFSDQLMIKEVKIEVHKERRDEIHMVISTIKGEKSRLFDRREELIQKKRELQHELHDALIDQVRKDTLSEKISELSTKIGEVIEESKSKSEEMQRLYDESQVEHQQMVDSIQELKQMKRDSDSVIMSYKRKIADADNELTGLRRKMSDIQNKLEKLSDWSIDH